MTDKTTIAKFWDWFAANKLELRQICDGRHDLIDSILIELRKIRTGLAVEFEKNSDNIIMTVSADGVESNFDIVEEIIGDSPLVKSWEFIAFRQPVEREKIDKIQVNVYGFTLDPKQIMFLPVIEENDLYIQIFSKVLTDDNKNEIGYGCLMLLDNIVGEYDCVKKVKAYEFYSLTEAQDFISDLKPLTKMKDFLDNYYPTTK